MIGYMKPQRSRMSKADWRVFRTYYCTVCHTLRRHFSYFSPLFLSFEAVCFRILADSVQGIERKSFPGMCSYTPMIPVRYADYHADAFNDTAISSLKLAMAELEDDETDRDRPFSRILLKILRRQLKKESSQIGADIRELSEEELSAETSFLLDKCASLAADLMIPVYADMVEDKMIRMKAVIGECAKWEYLLDAFDDLEKDKKKNQFNLLYTLDDIETGVTMMSECRTRIRKLIAEMNPLINDELIEYLFCKNPARIENEVLRGRGLIHED